MTKKLILRAWCHANSAYLSYITRNLSLRHKCCFVKTMTSQHIDTKLLQSYHVIDIDKFKLEFTGQSCCTRSYANCLVCNEFSSRTLARDLLSGSPGALCMWNSTSNLTLILPCIVVVPKTQLLLSKLVVHWFIYQTFCTTNIRQCVLPLYTKYEVRQTILWIPKSSSNVLCRSISWTIIVAAIWHVCSLCGWHCHCMLQFAFLTRSTTAAAEKPVLNILVPNSLA